MGSFRFEQPNALMLPRGRAADNGKGWKQGALLPFGRFGIEVAQIGVAVKDEVDAQFAIVKVIEHDKRRARDRIDVQAQMRVSPLCVRMDGEEVFKGSLNLRKFRIDHAASDISLSGRP